MNLYKVTVESREARTVCLRVAIDSLDEVTFPLSPSFVMMLIDDECADHHARFDAWEQAETSRDPFFSPHDHITSIRLRSVSGLPREQGEPPQGMTRDDVDAAPEGVLGLAVYEISVDIDGMLDHLDPGERWGSTAYNELDDGPLHLGRAGDPTEWARSVGLLSG